MIKEASNNGLAAFCHKALKVFDKKLKDCLNSLCHRDRQALFILSFYIETVTSKVQALLAKYINAFLKNVKEFGKQNNFCYFVYVLMCTPGL